MSNIEASRLVNTAEQRLGHGIEISSETISKIQAFMPQVREHKSDQELTCFSSEGNFIFRIASEPGLIFKMTESRNDESEQQRSERRFNNMIRATQVCEEEQFDLLVVPHAKRFTVDKTTVIAEEFFQIEQHFTKQEELYQNLPDETARQLAFFIAKTGFFDADYRNIPMLNERQIALIDLEGMNDAHTGFFGKSWFNIRGLVRCLFSEKQIDETLAIAASHNFTTGSNLKQRRMEEIASYRKLEQFHESRGILDNPRKPIQVDDITTLGLNLDEEGKCPDGWSYDEETGKRKIKPVFLRQAVVDVIAIINEAIAETPEGASTKGKRAVMLNTNHHPLLRDYTEACSFPYCETFWETTPWIRQIVDALVEKGHLFALLADNGHGYIVQA